MAVGRPANKKPSPTLTTVRRSQIVTTFGIGALIPVEQESYIVLGQDSWPPYWSSRDKSRMVDEITGRNLNEIDQPDLSRALNNVRFIIPPTENARVPVARFPRLASCPNCHRLDRWTFLAHTDAKGKQQNICKFCLPEKHHLITSRFVVACKAGHLDDFPYFRWVHNDESPSDKSEKKEHGLSLITTGDAESLKGIEVRCKCGAHRTMEGALGTGSTKLSCTGTMPWLGHMESTSCTETPYGLQRGATRVWQQKIASAISLDKKEGREFEAVRANLNFIHNVPDKSMLDLTFAMISQTSNVPIADLKRAYGIISGTSGESLSMDELRAMEYHALCEGKPEDPERKDDQTFVCNVTPASPRAASEGKLQLTAVVPKLREVRALTGFSRVDTREGETVTPAPLSNKKEDWLPAIEVFGEGIFIHFDEAAVQAWEQSPFAQKRAQLINDVHQHDDMPIAVTPRHLLLHSASHMLLNELALRAGYPASSIRERIYDDPDQAGILLYTAGTDSAGSLGGLCALGTEHNLLTTLHSGLETAAWCSADPVCIESPVHGPENLNLAACHYCMLLPEVSCERQNRVLDRACLVGTPDEPTGGFFSDLLND